jgi:anti-sigma B factor antagonist
VPESSRRTDVWRLSVSTIANGETVQLSVAGRVGHSGAAELAAALASAVTQSARAVILDFARVDYLSSPGIRLLDQRARELEQRGGTLQVRHVSDPVRLALDLAGLERLYQDHVSGET